MSAYHSFFSAESAGGIIQLNLPRDAGVQYFEAELVTEKGQSVGVAPVPLRPWPAQSMDVPAGYNLSTTVRSTEPVTAKTLRAVARDCDLVRIAIQMVKDQIRGLEWDITAVPGFKVDVALEARRQRIREFFRRPDPLNDIGFHDWLGAWLEDLMVLDAPTLLVVTDRAGRLVALPQIDGSTIKPILDPNGFVPNGDAPAYSQIIDGQVVTNFTRDQLLYTPYNVQPDRPYGLSPVEMVITSAHLALKRQLWNLMYFTDGSVPDYLIGVPKEWTSTQIKETQIYLDSYLAGSMARRRKMKLIPGGMEPHAMKQNDFSVAMDEWLARIIGAVFGVAPHLLLRQRTKQQASAMESQQTYTGLHPKTRFFAEIMTERVIRYWFGEPRLQFSWLSDKREEQEFNLRRASTMLPLGATSVDEMRVSEGKQPYGIPPYIQQPNGLLFITERLKEKLANGEIDYIDSRGVAISLDDPPPAQPAAPSGPQKPQPSGDDSKDRKDSKGDEEGKKTVATEPQGRGEKELIVAELKKWRQCVLADLKRGLSVRHFTHEFVPDDIRDRVYVVLTKAIGNESATEMVKAGFGAIIEGVRGNALRLD